MNSQERGSYKMAREIKSNRFANAGQALVSASKEAEKNDSVVEAESAPKKNKVITAKVYPDTWASFTAINRAQGMTNNSVINMLISEYVRTKKDILE